MKQHKSMKKIHDRNQHKFWKLKPYFNNNIYLSFTYPLDTSFVTKFYVVI